MCTLSSSSDKKGRGGEGPGEIYFEQGFNSLLK